MPEVAWFMFASVSVLALMVEEGRVLVRFGGILELNSRSSCLLTDGVPLPSLSDGGHC